VKVGDSVEADLGGAYFAARVTRISSDGSSYDVQFFDGDSETGLPRSMIRLLDPPSTPKQTETGTKPSQMTAKQLRRSKKKQEKLSKKR
jgi:hypothetical protein